MKRYCKRCGQGTDDEQPVVCTVCGLALVVNNGYIIPIRNVVTGETENHAQAEARMLLGDPTRYTPVADGQLVFNVRIDGELNGVPLGKKIQEKNEQLKKKVAGYEREQRNVRADVERQLAKKQAQGLA